MLAEFKRDSARKELEKVLADINGKRHQLREMEEEEQREESKQRTNNNQQVGAYSRCTVLRSVSVKFPHSENLTLASSVRWNTVRQLSSERQLNWNTKLFIVEPVVICYIVKMQLCGMGYTSNSRITILRNEVCTFEE